MKRIVCRLEGGAKAENLKHICRALEITPKTKKWNLAAIEVVLKQKRFRQYGTFRPTSQIMTLSYDRFYESIRLQVAINPPIYGLRSVPLCEIVPG